MEDSDLMGRFTVVSISLVLPVSTSTLWHRSLCKMTPTAHACLMLSWGISAPVVARMDLLTWLSNTGAAQTPRPAAPYITLWKKEAYYTKLDSFTYLFCCYWLTKWHTKYEKKKSFCALGCCSLWHCTQMNHQEFDQRFCRFFVFFFMCAGLHHTERCKSSTERLANHRGLVCSKAEPWMKQREEEGAKAEWKECFFLSFENLEVFWLNKTCLPLEEVEDEEEEEAKKSGCSNSHIRLPKWLALNAKSAFDVNTPEVLWLLLELLNELKSD